MPEVADIFRLYGPAYLERFGKKILPSHRRAMEDILHCRTSVLGGQVYVCDKCGREHYSYHSCRNRSCPKCHTDQTETWLAERRKELLPVGYFHVIFTIPTELRPLVRRYQKDLYGVLLTAAARSLIQLAADPHYIGGLVGVLAVLHTWTGTLDYHPHVHILVPAGGVSADRTEWRAAREEYLVPVKALSKIFCGIFRDLAKEKLPAVVFPDTVWKKPWVVFAKPTIQGPDKVLEYLGRYVYRVAITNRRILDIENGKVTFRYKESKTGQAKTMTLDAMEFIRRFLQHVLPQGTHKVRYYGLWSPTNRKLRQRLQLLLGGLPSRDDPAREKKTTASMAMEPSPPARRCPECGRGLLIPTARRPRQPRRTLEFRGRAPP
jgi:hypothetical protein